MAGPTADRLGCPEFRRGLRLDRRGFLKLGLMGAAGIGLSDLLRREARAGAATARPHSVILLWMRGGPSHIDTWDPKPDAPVEYRGEFGAIPTRLPGVFLCELLPMTAAMLDRWSIVRSLTHPDPGHSTADQLCFTGYPAGPLPDENVRPSFGSIAARQLGYLSPEMPAYVMIPRMDPGAGPAYLGVAAKPFETIADPAMEAPFRVENFALPEGVSTGRTQGRRALVAAFDRLRRDVDGSGQLEALDRFDRQAWDILTSSRARDAFDLEREDPRIRDRYGFLPAFRPAAANRCGAWNWAQRMLLARRLVEAGVRVVTVDLRWWDTHVLGFESLRLGFLPRFDRAFSALIEDLDQRGLLETTLVVAWGEFGRTPRVNNDAGRDHYPNVFSAAMAGGGVQGGRIVGSSDARAAFPLTNPKSPQDVLATIYRHLGVDTAAHYEDHAGRPIAVLPSGRPIDELF